MGEMTFDQPTPESPPTNPPASAAPAPEGPPSVSTPVSSEAETPSPYGETLLTRADRSPEKAPPPPEPKPTDPEPEAATVPDGPDGYQLAFAPETSVDQELLGDFRKTAHGLGLTQEQAKTLAGLYEAHAGRAADQAQKSQVEALIKAKAGWEAEIMASPTFQADYERASLAIERFGSPELKNLMKETVIGSHPAMFNFVAQIGRALVEPKFRGQGEPEKPPTPLYERIWPTNTKE